MGCSSSIGGKQSQAAVSTGAVPVTAEAVLVTADESHVDVVPEAPLQQADNICSSDAKPAVQLEQPRPAEDADTVEDTKELENQLSSEDTEDPEPRPWGRFLVLWLCCCVSCGMLPGQSLFVKLLAEAGIFRSSCTDDLKDGSTDTCKDQFVVLTGLFQLGMSVALVFLAPIGLLYDRWGARVVGTVGAAMCAGGLVLVWLSVVGADAGQDAMTCYLFVVGLFVCDFGSMLNSFSFMGLIWHFPNAQAFIIALINATYQVSAFLPMISEWVMSTFGVDFGMVILIWSGLLVPITYICWRLVPSQSEYYDRAKRSLGMPLPRPPKQIQVCRMMKRAWAVLRHDTWDHVASGLAITAGFPFPSFYASMAAPYGKELFGTKKDGDFLAELTVSLTGVVGLVLGPFCGGLADFFGMHTFVVVFVIIQIVQVATCALPVWTAQVACVLAGVIWNTLFNLFISRYLLKYSPPNRLGAVQGLYTLIVVVVSMPWSCLGLGLMEVLPPGLNAYRVPFFIYGISGVIVNVMYVFYYFSHPLPEVPHLLEDDEAELARNFGCGSLEEVMQVVQISDRSQLIKMLSTTDPEVMHALMRRIDTGKMVEMMAERPVEDIAQMMEDGDWGETSGDDESQKKGKDETGSREPLLGSDDMELADPQEDPSTVESSEEVDDRIRRLGKQCVALIAAKDAAGLRNLFMTAPIDDLWDMTLDFERWQSEAQQKEMEKEWERLIPGKEFAKMLRQRKELRGYVQKSMKRQLDKRIAGMRRGKNH